MKRLWLLVLLSLASAPVFAYFVDGTDLVEWKEDYRAIYYKTGEDYVPAARYMGQVMSIVDILLYDGQIVIPERVTVGQICLIVAKWLDMWPERWGEPAVVLIRDALLEAYGVD